MSYFCPFPVIHPLQSRQRGSVEHPFKRILKFHLARKKIPGASGTESLQQKKNASASPKMILSPRPASDQSSLSSFGPAGGKCHEAD
jgi:hypothetical protein